MHITVLRSPQLGGSAHRIQTPTHLATTPPPTLPHTSPYLLPDVDLSEALEEIDDGHVQPLLAPLVVPLPVESLVHDGKQPQHTGGEIPVNVLLHRGGGR